MRPISITGTGITPFGKFPDRDLRSLAVEAAREALKEASCDPSQVQFVAFGNALGAALNGLEGSRGQILLADLPLGGVPIINVENACATSSSAFHIALAAIGSGLYDRALVVGAEKMAVGDTRKILDAMVGGLDPDRVAEWGRALTGHDTPAESFFMEVYSKIARDYLERSDATVQDFADIAVKNSNHGLMNDKAQYRRSLTREDVLNSRIISDPITKFMCAPIADGAAAVVLQADEIIRPGQDAVRVLGSAVRTAIPGGGEQSLETRTANAVFEMAGVGPDDLDLAEVHDGASPNELILYETLGLAAPGEGAALLRSGATKLGGKVPFNVSGGLVSRGHPVGATGIAQIVEIAQQLNGRSGQRQVEGARIGLAETAGGYLHPEPATCAMTILSN